MPEEKKETLTPEETLIALGLELKSSGTLSVKNPEEKEK